MKILIATFNRGKRLEYKTILTNLSKKANINLTCVTPEDLKIKDKVKETGKTFAQNSLLKARFYADVSGLPTLADDGGIEIPILNNEPGVFSRRWPGYEATDDELITYTLEKLKKYKSRYERCARLVVCITFINPRSHKIHQASESIKGYVSDQIYSKYIKGYPYRALFIVDGVNKYYDELTKQEHEQYNHRRKALEKLRFFEMTDFVI